MRIGRRHSVAFVDLLLNALLSFVALFILAYIQVNPKAKQDKPVLATDGKYAVIMDWEDNSTADVDLYVQDPLGNIVWFGAKDVGLMHLEHDDLGASSEEVNTGHGVIRVAKNEERVILRGVIPGEYTVNVRMYNVRDSGGAHVKIRLCRVSGANMVIVQKERFLDRDGEEKTAFRFTITPSNMVTNINELPKRMEPRQRGGNGAPFGGGPPLGPNPFGGPPGGVNPFGGVQ